MRKTLIFLFCILMLTGCAITPETVGGIAFTDDTGASVTLSADDAAEATTLDLSAGDFVLYIKADQAEYLTGDKHFTLKADGYAETTFTMKIVETVPEEDENDG